MPPFTRVIIAYTADLGLKNCVQVFKGQKEKSIKLTTRQGFTLEGSHRHPVLVVDDKGNETWKKLPDIRYGERLVMRKGMQAFSKTYVTTDTFKYPNDSRVKIKVPKFINEDIAYLMGQLVGDGNYSDPEYQVRTD